VDLADNEIGRLDIAFENGDGLLTARLDMVLAVNVAFIPAWSYRLQSVERWQGDRLVGFSSVADDDGRPHTLDGEAVGDGFRLVATRDGAPNGTEMAPADTAPPSYWRRDVLDRPVLFNPQTGQLRPQQVLASRRETIRAAGRPIPAQAFQVTLRGVGWVWYDERDRWLAAVTDREGVPLKQTLIG
jgi:hypothetical protein